MELPTPGTLAFQIMDVLLREGKPLPLGEISNRIDPSGSTYNTIKNEAPQMKKQGLLTRPARGLYKLSPTLRRSFAEHRKKPGMDAAPSLQDSVGYEAKSDGSPGELEYRYMERGPAAGDGKVQIESEETIRVPRSISASWANGRVIPPDRGYWTRVQGSSMEPWLPDQMPIFVERCDDVQDGARYVIHLGDRDGEVVKRIERVGDNFLLLKSDNPVHETMRLEHMDENVYRNTVTDATLTVRVTGRVVFPADTPMAIMRTVTAELARIVGVRTQGPM